MHEKFTIKCFKPQATVTKNNGQFETYVGLSSTPFWQRYANHKKSFSKPQYCHETTLSTFIWELKAKNINFTISWKIVDSPVSGECQLCLKEKYVIIFKPEASTLNSRNELANTCRHKSKSLLMRTK